MTPRLFLALPFLFSAIVTNGCASDTEPQPQDEDAVEVGPESEIVTAKLAKKYGGQHLAVTLTATGGDLSFDCGAGSLSAPLKLDASGRFSVAGTFTRGTGVRPLPGNEPKPQAVQYKGDVTGSKMSIRFTNDGFTQKFTLSANSDAVLIRCL